MQYLYIIKCQQYYKIGITYDVESRLAQLSTGNPFPLEVEILYGFEGGADYIERAIHQRYKESRQRGEWFSLSYEDLQNIHSICLGLGASAREYTGIKVTDEVMEETEQLSQPVNGSRWDFAAMFADGWIMEKANSKGWRWRNTNPAKDIPLNSSGYFIYGGLIKDLPNSIENMTRAYRDNVIEKSYK